MTDDELDQALAQYAGVEPWAGIEQRVLNRIRAEGAAPRSACRRWLAAACAAAATMAIAAGIWWTRPIPEIAVAVTAIQKAPQWVAIAPAKPVRRRAIRASLPRQPEFPTPAPVSSEERTWLALAAPGPNPAREALLDLERRGAAPIEIEPIKIEPIKIEPLRSDDAE